VGLSERKKAVKGELCGNRIPELCEPSDNQGPSPAGGKGEMGAKRSKRESSPKIQRIPAYGFQPRHGRPDGARKRLPGGGKKVIEEEAFGQFGAVKNSARGKVGGRSFLDTRLKKKKGRP